MFLRRTLLNWLFIKWCPISILIYLLNHLFILFTFPPTTVAQVWSCIQRGTPSDDRLAKQRRFATRVIYQFDSPYAGWRRPRGKPLSDWEVVVRQDLQQINLALEDIPTLCQDSESWRDKVALVGSKASMARDLAAEAAYSSSLPSSDRLNIFISRL